MIPPFGGQTGEELGLEAGALERWDNQKVVRRRPQVQRPNHTVCGRWGR